MKVRVAGSVVVAVAALSVAALAQRGSRQRVAAGQECPPGTTETRPGNCQAPEFPAPSIIDYRPKSTLVTTAHLVPKSKFPSIDIHGHPPSLTTAASIEAVVSEMDKLNLRVLVSADNSSGDRLTRVLQAINASPYKDRFRVLAGINFNNVGPGLGRARRRAARSRPESGRRRCRRSAEVVRVAQPEAGRLTAEIDDPELDPIWAAFARLGVPAFIHTAEPQEFFQPLDMHNERWLELSLFADRRNNQPGGVTFEELMTERNNVFRKHPKTPFIAAHFGWHANDLARAAKMLDDFPNVTVEVGAILYDLGRQPRAAHDFFLKYQDRIMFGKDAFEPSEYPYYWRVFETSDDYFDYYRELSRLLEAVRHQPSGRGVEEAVLQERAARGQRTAAERVAAVAPYC